MPDRVDPRVERPEPDWLAIARYKYLMEPEFHAFVEVIVQEKLRAVGDPRDAEIAHKDEVIARMDVEVGEHISALVDAEAEIARLREVGRQVVVAIRMHNEMCRRLGIHEGHRPGRWPEEVALSEALGDFWKPGEALSDAKEHQP